MNPEFNIQEEFIELKLFDVVFSLDVFLRLNIIMDEIALELSGSEKKRVLIVYLGQKNANLSDFIDPYSMIDKKMYPKFLEAGKKFFDFFCALPIQKIGICEEHVTSFHLELSFLCNYTLIYDNSNLKVSWPDLCFFRIPVLAGIVPAIKKIGLDNVLSLILEYEVLDKEHAVEKKIIDSVIVRSADIKKQQTTIQEIISYLLSLPPRYEDSLDFFAMLKNRWILFKWQKKIRQNVAHTQIELKFLESIRKSLDAGADLQFLIQKVLLLEELKKTNRNRDKFCKRLSISSCYCNAIQLHASPKNMLLFLVDLFVDGITYSNVQISSIEKDYAQELLKSTYKAVVTTKGLKGKFFQAKVANVFGRIEICDNDFIKRKYKECLVLYMRDYLDTPVANLVFFKEGSGDIVGRFFHVSISSHLWKGFVILNNSNDVIIDKLFKQKNFCVVQSDTSYFALCNFIKDYVLMLEVALDCLGKKSDMEFVIFDSSCDQIVKILKHRFCDLFKNNEQSDKIVFSGWLEFIAFVIHDILLKLYPNFDDLEVDFICTNLFAITNRFEGMTSYILKEHQTLHKTLQNYCMEGKMDSKILKVLEDFVAKRRNIYV